MSFEMGAFKLAGGMVRLSADAAVAEVVKQGLSIEGVTLYLPEPVEKKAPTQMVEQNIAPVIETAPPQVEIESTIPTAQNPEAIQDKAIKEKSAKIAAAANIPAGKIVDKAPVAAGVAPQDVLADVTQAEIDAENPVSAQITGTNFNFDKPSEQAVG